MADKTVFKLGELFCGPGGLACGAIRSHSNDGKYSVEHAWANDYDEDTCETYKKNICPQNPSSVYLSDVRDLDISNLGHIDAFAYGFPCNSFSNVGEHQGIANEKFGQLYWYGVEVLREYRPSWFIAENVSGIRSAGAGGGAGSAGRPACAGPRSPGRRSSRPRRWRRDGCRRCRFHPPTACRRPARRSGLFS